MVLKSSPRIRDYYDNVLANLEKVYSLATKAREEGLDPDTSVEVKLANDLADRVEGLVGPKGIAKLIRESKMTRETLALKVIEKIVSGEFGGGSKEELAEMAIRSSLALLTEGVVAAPIEGISKVTIDKNPDGTKYLTVHYAGPIRSAGGTAQAISVLLADYTRQILRLDRFKPTDTEVERYVEEINLYHSAVARLQYKPTDDEVRLIVRNCPVCISGDPTAQVEVDAYKDLERFPGNRVRGGMCLVLAEGIAQKAKKLVKYSKIFGLDWSWINTLVKVDKAEKPKLSEEWKYLSELVAGRPIFSYPSRTGAFRVRYGRGRNTGLMAKAVHPATMVILDEFPAIGTQLKIERPGKGCTLTTNDKIRGPVVRLRDGSVTWVDSIDLAKKVRGEVEEILFLGDILVSYGDFLKSNYPIVPSPYVEEWWVQDLEKAGGNVENPYDVDLDSALDLSSKYNVPLHPRYTLPFNEISVDDLKRLSKWLVGDRKVSEEKRILEELLVPHRVDGDQVIIDSDFDRLLQMLIPWEKVKAANAEDALSLVNSVSRVKVMHFSHKFSYIGARMGRPEKARERKMSPPPHLLFPVGQYGGSTRSLLRASEETNINVETANLFCPKCKKDIFSYKCPTCGTRAVIMRKNGKPYSSRQIPLKALLEKAIKKVGHPGDRLKGVIGTTSEMKMFEPIEKGILRSRYNVYVFKDGTIRFDSTNLPLTHFKPSEIGVSVEKLKELGYLTDYKGNPLERDDQIVELFPQDVIISEHAGDYLSRVSMFIDELLEKFYGLPRFYNVSSRKDIIGHLVIGLAPHTSAGVLGRIIGFTKANAWYAHPYFHAATRRDCDGDENACMLALDAFINFSKSFLPASRGGKMDAPLVLTTVIDPSQVDDQVHEMESIGLYPLEFYEKSQGSPMPDEIKLEIVRDRLGTDRQYDGFGFSVDTSDINLGVYKSAYTKFENMVDKVYAQLNLGKKIRAVDERDEAKKILDFHFIRDIYGNLRSFGQQSFRCVSCNAKYRRPPLIGVCTKCGGKIILTITEGSVRKYLDISRRIAKEFGLSDYANQRLAIVEKSIESIFKNDKVKQSSIADFM